MVTRKEVLQMLSEGKIDVARATELLAEAREADQAHESVSSVPPEPEAVADFQPPMPPPAPAAPAPPGPSAVGKQGRRWLHIHVSDLESGKNRVRVNVPLGLVNFGLKVGARFTDEVNADVMHDVLDALRDESLTGTLVEVEDSEDNERVHIFID
jgi:hypothetical protein